MAINNGATSFGMDNDYNLKGIKHMTNNNKDVRTSYNPMHQNKIVSSSLLSTEAQNIS